MSSQSLVGSRSSASRRKARVVALQVLYEIDGARHDPERAFDNRLREQSLSPAAEAFARKLLEGVIQHRAEIDKTISTYATAWPIKQVAILDRNILRLAVFEIMIDVQTPPKVAINEAVELGKIFGSDNSAKFVNGVLGSVMENAQLSSET